MSRIPDKELKGILVGLAASNGFLARIRTKFCYLGDEMILASVISYNFITKKVLFVTRTVILEKNVPHVI